MASANSHQNGQLLSYGAKADSAVLLESVPLFEPSETQADALVAKQMTELTSQEREKVYHDLHGISEDILETVPFIRGALAEFDWELKTLQNKDAYEMARFMNPKYVEDPKFRLRFLRTDLFDAKKAALRFVRHFQAKLELFGRDKLARDIVQDDLSEEDMDTLYSCFLQVLPTRDQGGRRVTMAFPYAKNRAFSSESKVSPLWCLIQQLDFFPVNRAILTHWLKVAEVFL